MSTILNNRKPMLKITLSILLFSLFHISSQAQSFTADLHLGVANIGAVDLTSLQGYIIENANLPLKSTDSYPARPQFGLSILRKKDVSTFVGFHWLYSSTGGRVAVSDYSGTVTSDQILNTHQLGFSTGQYFKETKLFHPYLGVQLSALLSNLELKDNGRLTNGEQVSSSSTFVAQNVGLHPMVGFKFDQLPVILKLELGYLIQVTQFPFHLKENRDATLSINENEVGPGLSGFRGNISFSFDIFK
ncbi:MAG: hypothetical protein ABJI33_07955 [Balneola sp.]